MPPRKQKGPFQKPQNAGAAVKRLFSYMGEFKGLLVLVVFFIIFSTLASVAGTQILQVIIDDYITPLIGHRENTELFGRFVKTLGVMLTVYIIGALCTFGYQRIMLSVSTKTLFEIRKDVFEHMETLPIKYFDTHTHGDLMSRYTNDIDTIREMMSNSVTSFISSAITVVSVFIMMVYNSWQLTLVVLAMLAVMLFITAFIGSRSGRYFKEQQTALGKVNGYIEEMIDGQKVVKVFVHEDKSKAEFAELNDPLRGCHQCKHLCQCLRSCQQQSVPCAVRYHRHDRGHTCHKRRSYLQRCADGGHAGGVPDVHQEFLHAYCAGFAAVQLGAVSPCGCGEDIRAY